MPTKKAYRKRVPKRKDHGGVPQMMVAVSAEPEFGARRCSIYTAYKFCYGLLASERLERVMAEAKRRIAAGATV